MAQISVVISNETEKLLEEMARITGLTKSSLAAEILRQGLYTEASRLTTVASFREKFVIQSPQLPTSPTSTATPATTPITTTDTPTVKMPTTDKRKAK